MHACKECREYYILRRGEYYQLGIGISIDAMIKILIGVKMIKDLKQLQFFLLFHYVLNVFLNYTL